jgi:hypothetical protein
LRGRSDRGTRRRLRTGLWLAGLAGLMVLIPPQAVAAERPAVTLTVVVAKNSKLRTLSLSDLRQLFTSQSVTGPDGRKLVPLNHPPLTRDRAGFDRVVLKMSPEQVGRFWIDQRIRGRRGPPRSVGNVTLLQRVVARLPGAIAYVRPAHVIDQVKTIRIEGKAHDEAGYPLVYRD